MPLLFFGIRRKAKAEEVIETDERLLERTKELLDAYNRLTDSVLIDTVRFTESLLDQTGLSDIDRTLWGADFPKEDVESVATDDENLKAVLKAVKRLYHKISSLDAEIIPMNYEMRYQMENRGTNFAEYTDQELAIFRIASKKSREMRELLMINVLDEAGRLTDLAKETSEKLMVRSAR